MHSRKQLPNLLIEPVIELVTELLHSVTQASDPRG